MRICGVLFPVSSSGLGSVGLGRSYLRMESGRTCPTAALLLADLAMSGNWRKPGDSVPGSLALVVCLFVAFIGGILRVRIVPCFLPAEGAGGVGPGGEIAEGDGAPDGG